MNQTRRCRISGTSALQLLAMLGLVGLNACTDGQSSTGDVRVGPSALSNAVAGAAAEALDDHGRMRFGEEAVADGEIGADRARLLAAGYVARFGALLEPALELQRGVPVATNRLRACGRAFYARSSYLPLPTSIDRPTRSIYGGWWVVQMCEGPAAVAVMAVSSLASDMGIDPSGAIAPMGGIAGNEFVLVGVPSGKPYGPLVSPEDAVLRANRITGRRITDVPELVAGKAGPFSGWWRVQLESSAKLRRTRGTEIVTAEIGIRGTDESEALVADNVQPASEGYLQPIGIGSTTVTFQQAQIARDPSLPLALSPAVSAEGQ